MKKLVAAMMIATAPMAAAKLGFNVDASAGGAYQTLNSDSYIVSTDHNLSKGLGLKAKPGMYLSASFEHPIPLIPNVRAHYKSQVLTGTKTLAAPISFFGETIPAQDVTTTLDLSHVDAILFWGVPLLPVIDVDFGINTRILMAGLDVDLPPVVNTAGTKDISVSEYLPLPMGYLSVDGDIPFVGINVGGEYKFLPAGDTQVSEVNVYGRYFLPLPTNLLAKVGVEAGYRQFNLKIADKTLGMDTSKLASDVTIDGFYAGVTASF